MTRVRAALLAMAAASVLLGGCRTTLPPYDYAREPDPRQGEVVLGVADRLRIVVWKNPDLTTDAVVRPDGTITMPLIGDLKAAGRTPTDLKKEIIKRLAAYIKAENVIVTVAVTEYNSYRFVVSGRVNRPGVYTARRYLTIREALTMAGGITRFADPRGCKVMRRDARGARQIPFDCEKVLSGEAPRQNLVLLAGDTVFVP